MNICDAHVCIEFKLKTSCRLLFYWRTCPSTHFSERMHPTMNFWCCTFTPARYYSMNECAVRRGQLKCHESHSKSTGHYLGILSMRNTTKSSSARASLSNCNCRQVDNLIATSMDKLTICGKLLTAKKDVDPWHLGGLCWHAGWWWTQHHHQLSLLPAFQR